MTTRTQPVFLCALLAGLALTTLAACQKSEGGGAAAGKAASAAAGPVERIVFVDKKDACDCTRARADGTWANLERALAETRTVPVERIYMDTEKDRAAPYLAKQSLMVVPGVYFLGAGDSLLELQQGEVSVDELEAALGR